MQSTIQKCECGVYDPYGDQAYCSVCNPVSIPSSDAKVKKAGPIKIGIFNNSTKIEDLANELMNDERLLPETKQAAWYKYAIRELAMEEDLAAAA